MLGGRKRKRVLYFGRFQPFHYGHYYALRWLLGRYDEVVVLIGMASESHTWRNPFTAGERMAMIEAVAEWAGISSRVRVAVMPTLEVYAGNAYYILYMFSPIEAVATRNSSVADAFRYAGVRVVSPPYVRRDVYRGERIRELLSRNDSSWRDLVPPPVAGLIEAIGGVERVKRIRGQV